MSSALLTLFAEHRKLVLEHPRHLRRHALLLLHRLFQRPFRTPFQLCHILQHVRERHKVQGVEHVEGVDGRVNGIIYLILEIEEMETSSLTSHLFHGLSTCPSGKVQ